MLLNVCENCFTEFGTREAPSCSVCSLSYENKSKRYGILIDKPKREKPKTVRTLEKIAAVAESACEAPSFSTIEHFGDIIETNFA